jgi:transposase
MPGRRRYSKEFKHEAVRLVLVQKVAMTQVARDLDLHVNVLRNWVRAVRDDPTHAFPGEGHQKPEDAEMTRLRREVVKLRAERDILKKAAAYFAKEST